MSWRYQLTDREWHAARTEALTARDWHRQLGHTHRAQLPIESELLYMTLGIAGEMAFSAMTGLPRIGTIYGTPAQMGTPDFAPDIELRTARWRGHSLLIRPENDPARRYVLVVCVEPWAFEARGWLAGQLAMLPDYLQAQAGRPAAYFVPQAHLAPMATLQLPGQSQPLPW